ncbi:SGNH hydrolase-type esterase domain-containing protein [Lipomyces tetrasporus]|uniref:SGNH hydrolase-type esterase domain-containing protein n=1 Tax=Lipomyces tetrasporus TaxID=54092 RepID=A0AAD7QNQ9_9ASCO|nr:SGNH hydrolase-type esterase domain-containing protein [Lipomyces tetrasporus]KAJ8098787.1 SGNH hydrolase-type esterase domain-containing protein [Lipomyces tetrasporus]
MAIAFDKVLLFGDSITQYAYNQDNGFCFGPAMQNAYCRKFDVIQRGFGGYNSNHAVIMVDKIIEQETTPTSKIKLMVVFFGTNDSVVPEAVQHVPILRYKDNLRKIASSAEKAGAKIVIVGPGPYNHHQWVIGREDRAIERTTLRAREYCDAAIEVAKELNVAMVPLWYLIMADLGWKEGDPVYGLAELPAKNPLTSYLNDGLHYLGKAYRVEFNNVIAAIKETYPELDPATVTEKLPTWDKISSLDVLKAALE